MNRTVGILLASIWVIAMAALIRRDVLPFWTANDAPCQIIADESYQVGICNDAGQRLGTTWVTTDITPSMSTVTSTSILDMGRVSSLLPVRGHLVMKNDLVYGAGGELDRFTFQVDGPVIKARIDGEKIVNDFACKVTIGPITKTIVLESRQSEYLGESLRPFTRLKDLSAGQKWRLRVLDPFSILQDQALEFKTQLATVTGRETIWHNGRDVDCFRIETDGTVAWSDDAGRVLRQEVKIPVLGRFILTDEPFDRSAFIRTSSMPR
ncbi:MAG TPA: hypothetical protein VMV94_01395 [Phycisphaerae bacterium]|nr:hypothetical protein [Phycisphaerae bacterium]